MNSPTATFARLSLHSPAVTNQDINPLAHHTSNKRKRSYDIPSSSNFATTSTPSTSSAQPTPDSGLIRCICGYTDDDGLTIFCDMCGYWQHMSCVLSNPPPLLKDDSATASDDDQTSSSTTSSRSSSKGKSTKPPTSTSSITSAALPEQWFCERCVPRPVDASAARARQTRRLQADRERLFRAAGIVEQIPNGRKKSRPENIDKRRRSTVTGTQQITTESVRRSKSGTSSRKPTSNRNRSSSVDISPLDEDTMFEPWANEFVRINQDVIADEGVRQAIRHWRSSIEGNTRDSPTSSSRSQPPMPISPVTECSPLPPLPSIKVPPVRLLVKQVPPSECQPIPTPTIASLPPPNATPSYHDNTLHNSDPKSLSYGRPPTYGVYTSNSTSGTIPAGTLLATFVSRIIPVSAYTCAPLSQYALLQLPKPHVRLIPPPLSLALDAREMGNESRFIRNGCHPNAVIRPVISESSPAGVEWGVYSMRSISAKGEEIVLGWEWDANSPVQLLNDVLENGCADVQDETNLKAEMCQILCTLGGTFTSCACGSGQKLSGSNKCVFTLMSQFICDRSQFTATTPFPLRMHAPSSPESLDGTSVKKEKPYLGPMLGAKGFSSLAPRESLMTPKSVSVSPPPVRSEISPCSTPHTPTPTPGPAPLAIRPPSPTTPPARLHSKSWASIVGLYDSPGPQPKLSNPTILPPSPAPSPDNHVSANGSRTLAGAGSVGKTMQDRSNLPHLNTNTRHSLPTPSSPSGSTTMEIPSSKSRSPEVGTMKLPAVALSVPGKSSLASPREWSTFALGGKLKRNASSSGVAETGKERGRSNSSSSRLSPTVESVEAWAEDVAMIDGDRNGARVGEVDGELEEVEEVVKLPPKMRKRAKNGNAGLSLVDSHSSCSTAESSLSPRELDDATLMPPPPLPASMDPTTVSSLSLTFALMAKTEERHLSPVSSHATTPRTPEREMSYEASSMSSERSREPSTSPRVSVEPSLGTVVEDDAMEVEVETDDSGLEPELATVDDSLSTEMEKRESSYRDEKPAASITVEKQLAHSSLTSASSVTVTTPVVEEASAPEVKPKTATSREATPDEAPSLIPWSQPPSSPLPSPAPTLTFSRAPSPPSIRHSSSDATEPTPLGPVVSRSSSSDAAPTFQVPLPDPVAETTSVPPSVPAPASNLKVDSEPAPPAPMPAPLPEEFPAPPPMPTEAPEPVPVPPPVPAPQPSFVPASASAPAFAPVPAPAARMSFADWKKKRALATAVATKQQEDKDKEMQEGRAVETVSIAVAEQGHKENVTTPAVALAPLRAPEVKAASAPVTISTATISREKTEGASAPAIKGGLASGPVPIDVGRCDEGRAVSPLIIAVRPLSSEGVSLAGDRDGTVPIVSPTISVDIKLPSTGSSDSVASVPVTKVPVSCAASHPELSPVVVKIEDMTEEGQSDDDGMDIDSDSIVSTRPLKWNIPTTTATTTAPSVIVEPSCNAAPVAQCPGGWGRISGSLAKVDEVICGRDEKPSSPVWRLGSHAVNATFTLQSSPAWEESQQSTQSTTSSSSLPPTVAPSFQTSVISDVEGAEDGEITSPQKKDVPLPEDGSQSPYWKMDSPAASSVPSITSTHRPSLNSCPEPPSPARSKYEFGPRSRALGPGSPSDSASVSSYSNRSPHSSHHTNGWYDSGTPRSSDRWRDDAAEWRPSSSSLSHHPYTPRDRDRQHDNRPYLDRYRTRGDYIRPYDRDREDDPRRWGGSGWDDQRDRYDSRRERGRDRDHRYAAPSRGGDWDQRRDHRDVLKQQRGIDAKTRDAEICKNNRNAVVR